MGEFSVDRPNFKFIMEKSGDISEVDIKAFLAAYKEANKPNSFITFRKQQLQAAANQETDGEKTNLGSWFSNANKQKSEAIKKLEEMGVSVFLPDKKSNSLDWVFSRDNESSNPLIAFYLRIILRATSNRREILKTLCCLLSLIQKYMMISLEALE